MATLNEQAEKILEIAEAAGVQSNFFFKTTFRRYQVQLNNLSALEKAINEFKLDKIVLAGGVSRNSYIRQEFEKLGQRLNIKVYEPEPILCTDNAAMIGVAGYYDYLAGKRAGLDLNAIPNLKLGER